MRQIITADPDQTLLLPPCMDDWVGPRHPARFIREFVRALDLRTLGLDTLNRSEGGPAYAPELLVGVWLYGYFRKVRSLRALELACQEEMGFLWLTGNTRPDHNALWRYWSEHREPLKALFKQSVKLAVRMELVGFALQALDGTKIQAKCSAYGSFDKEHLEKRLAELDEQLARMESDIAAAGIEPSVQLPEALETKAALREKIKAALAQVDEGPCRHAHPQEPSAMRMKTDKGMKFGHNAQAVADDRAQVVVAAELADLPTDQHALVPMLEAAAQLRREVGGQGPHQPPLTQADAGYATTTQLMQAGARDLPVQTPPPTGWSDLSAPYHTARFHHDAKRNVVICPEGQTLHWMRSRQIGERHFEVYGNQRACAQCPVRPACTQNGKGRQIEICQARPHLLVWSQAWQNPAVRKNYQRRAKIIEPVFAQIKQQMGFRRWTVLGKEKVIVQWRLLCTAWNLKVIFRHWQPGSIATLMAPASPAR
jgi:transposase